MAEDATLTVTTDEQLIADTLHGDISSFGIIVERYWNMIVALALSKINDPIAAEDIAQESFLKAYIHLRKLRNPGCFAGWLSKIVLQETVNHIRRCCRNAAGSRPAITCLEALNTALACSTNPGLTESQTSLVRHAISRLPERFQTIIVMRFVADLSAPEIAKQLGKRNGTVRVWLHRAYKLLRKDLASLIKEVEQ